MARRFGIPKALKVSPCRDQVHCCCGLSEHSIRCVDVVAAESGLHPGDTLRARGVQSASWRWKRLDLMDATPHPRWLRAVQLTALSPNFVVINAAVTSEMHRDIYW
eukprot:SAG11_NODE_5303_length_1602_cov_1.145709_1_plen_106_part_00